MIFPNPPKHCISRFAYIIYRFPSEPGLRSRWIAATGRENFIPSKRAQLCSKHFREEDMDRTSLCYVRIREGAVPSIFDVCTKNLQEEKELQKPLIAVQSNSDAALGRPTLHNDIKQCNNEGEEQ